MPYTAGLLLLKLIGNGLNLGFGSLVLFTPLKLISTALFSIIVGGVVGAIIESVVVKRKSRIIVSVVIAISVLTYFISLDTYLSRASDVNTKTIHLNNNYLLEIIKIQGINRNEDLLVSYRMNQNLHSKLIDFIDIKIIKDGKQYLPKGDIDSNYFSTFKYIKAPFIIRVGNIKVKDENGSNIVILSVYKDIQVRKFYQDNLSY